MLNLNELFSMEFTGIYAGQTTITKLGYVMTSYDGTDDLITVARTLAVTRILPEIASNQVNSYRYVSGKLISFGEEVLDEFTVIQNGGIANAVGMPPHDVVFMSFRPDSGGRSTSRFGMSGIPTTVQNEGVINQTALTAYQGLASTLLEYTDTALDNATIVRAFRVQGSNTPAIATKFKVLSSIRTLDSRRIGDGI